MARRIAVFGILMGLSCGWMWAGDGGFNGLPLGLDLSNTSDVDYGYVRIADHPALEPQRFTIEAWIRPEGNGYGSQPAVIGKPMESIAGYYIFSWMMVWRPVEETVWVYVTHVMNTTGGGAYVMGAADAAPLGVPVHVAMTFDGTWLRLYINGQLNGEVATGFDVVDYGDQDVLIGAANFASGYLRRFDGLIDEVRIWDHARVESEIAGQMDCALEGTEPGLLAYYSFNMTDAADDSGQGHDGVIEGTAGYVEFAQECMILFDGFDDGTTSGWD